MYRPEPGTLTACLFGYYTAAGGVLGRDANSGGPGGPPGPLGLAIA
jgi:hypothetical protein